MTTNPTSVRSPKRKQKPRTPRFVDWVDDEFDDEILSGLEEVQIKPQVPDEDIERHVTQQMDMGSATNVEEWADMLDVPVSRVQPFIDQYIDRKNQIAIAELDRMLADPQLIYVDYMRNAKYLQDQLISISKSAMESKDQISSLRELRGLNNDVKKVMGEYQQTMAGSESDVDQESMLLKVMQKTQSVQKRGKSRKSSEDDLLDTFFG